MKTLLQFGAGKIGRSFIAQLFSKADYKIIFADIDPCLVKSLNEAGEYHVFIKGFELEEKYIVKNVTAIEISAKKEMIKQITETDIIAISVGKKSLLNLAELLAEGIEKRYSTRKNDPVDIILAENVQNAASLLAEEIDRFITGVPLLEYVGFVETSIGKMVPLMTVDQIKADPLSIFAEPYNSLIVDASGFRNTIPTIPDLYAKSNMKAWVDRKIFIHSLGHAVLAYQCNFKYPDIQSSWQALEIKEIFDITKRTMQQSAAILCKLYPQEFNLTQITAHVDDLLHRFTNKALCDTIFRIGSDIPRKLASDDRLMIPILSAIKLGMDYDLILEAWVKGCYFNAKDEQGELFKDDREFLQKYQTDPLKILSLHCKPDDSVEEILRKKVIKIINLINNESPAKY